MTEDLCSAGAPCQTLSISYSRLVWWSSRREWDDESDSCRPVLGFALARSRFLLHQLPGGLERVDFADRLVRANSGDPWEAHGQAAIVTGALLNLVEGDFEHDVWFDFEVTAALSQRVIQEMLSELLDLFISQAAVGFADCLELARNFV